MNDKFRFYVRDLENEFTALISMKPYIFSNLPKGTPKGGVYLFSERDTHLYVGRTKRIIAERLRDHISTADDCPFAFRLARETTGNTTPSYRKQGSREELLKRRGFRKAYEDAKARIRAMDIRFVGETDPTKQALLEIYAAVVLETEYNDFQTS